MRVGIDLGGTKIEGIVLDDAGKIALRRRVDSPSHSYDAIIEAIGALVESLETEVGQPRGALRVGCGTPGALQPATGTMKNCNSVVLNGRPLLADLQLRLGQRVRIANDADCFALSEATDGAASGAATVFGVILGTGVGGGIVVRQKLLRGPNAIAGEWGHTPMPYLGSGGAPREDELVPMDCYCGRRGCVETFLSGPALGRIVSQLTGREVSARDVFSAPELRDVRELYASLLARALAQVINLLDPDVVVLGGGLSNQRWLYERVPALWGPFLFSPDCATELVAPRFGDSSGVRGAAWLW
ncbi:MAG: ROK family protein [Pseudomonadota bacterium]